MPSRPRRSKRSNLRPIELLGYSLLVLIPILGVATGLYLVMHKRPVIGIAQIIAALVVQSFFVGLIPLLLS